MLAHRGKATGGHSEKVAIFKSKGEVLSETNPVSNMILVF